MTMPTKTIATDEITDLEARIVRAARERAAFVGLTPAEAKSELAEARRLAAAVGAGLRAEHAIRKGAA
jgi:hypothetical protein